MRRIVPCSWRAHRESLRRRCFTQRGGLRILLAAAWKVQRSEKQQGMLLQIYRHFSKHANVHPKFECKFNRICNRIQEIPFEYAFCPSSKLKFNLNQNMMSTVCPDQTLRRHQARALTSKLKSLQKGQLRNAFTSIKTHADFKHRLEHIMVRKGIREAFHSWKEESQSGQMNDMKAQVIQMLMKWRQQNALREAIKVWKVKISNDGIGIERVRGVMRVYELKQRGERKQMREAFQKFMLPKAQPTDNRALELVDALQSVQRRTLSLAFHALRKPPTHPSKHYHQPYFKHALTSLVLCLQDTLTQRKSHAFSLLKQSLILRSHQSHAFLKLTHKLELRSLQQAMRRWVRQAWAKKSCETMNIYLNRQRVRAIMGIVRGSDVKAMKSGFCSWRQRTVEIRMKRTVVQVNALNRIQRIAKKYDPEARAFRGWKEFAKVVQRTERGLHILQGIKNRKMKEVFNKIREQRRIDKTRETKILCSALEKIQYSQIAQSIRKIMLFALSNHVQRQSDMVNARQAEISQQLKQLNEKDTFMKVQEAIFLTMKDNKSSSLLQNASTDHYSEREFTQNDKQKRMSEINRTVKQNDQTPPQALRPIVTERLSSGLGMTNKSINKHHSKSPQINIMIQRTPTSSNVYKSAVVQLESAKQTSITLQAQKAVKGTGVQNNRYSKNTPETVVSQMSESKQHVMQQLSSKQAPKQFELNLKLAREQNTVELESPLRNANPASFRFGKDKSPPATLPIQQFKASYISSSTIPNVQSSVSSFNSLKSSEFLSTKKQLCMKSCIAEAKQFQPAPRFGAHKFLLVVTHAFQLGLGSEGMFLDFLLCLRGIPCANREATVDILVLYYTLLDNMKDTCQDPPKLELVKTTNSFGPKGFPVNMHMKQINNNFNQLAANPPSPPDNDGLQHRRTYAPQAPPSRRLPTPRQTLHPPSHPFLKASLHRHLPPREATETQRRRPAARRLGFPEAGHQGTCIVAENRI